MDDYLDDSITKRNEKQKEVEFELFPIENSLFIYFISIYLISIDIAFELVVFDECGYVIIDSGKYILEYHESFSQIVPVHLLLLDINGIGQIHCFTYHLRTYSISDDN